MLTLKNKLTIASLTQSQNLVKMDTNVAWNVIKYNKVIPMSWGLHDLSNINGILAFKVQGRKFQGIVAVGLNGHDEYVVAFIKNNKVVEVLNGVYVDMLTSTIDEKVEK